MMEKNIYAFHTIFYIPYIQRFAFQLPHIGILIKNQCGELRYTVFKNSKIFQDILCHSDYSKRVVASFSHPIKS